MKAKPIPFTPDVAARLRGRDPDSELSHMRGSNPTRQPTGFWIDFTTSTPLLYRVCHAWGTEFWLEPVVTVTGESVEQNLARMDACERITAKTLAKRRREGHLIPASELDHGISSDRAAKLHKRMGVAGIKNHYVFAAKVRPSGWEVPNSLTVLTPRQAADLESRLQSEVDRGRLGPRRYLESRDGVSHSAVAA